MSGYLIKPARKAFLKGEITIPSSKSQTLRALLFAALAEGRSWIHQSLLSDDALRMIDACRLLGAEINEDMGNDTIEVTGVNGSITHSKDVIYAGNSGIVLRFLSALAGLGSHPFVITGDHSIRYQRPMQALLGGLSQLGVSAKSMRGDGYAPVIIQGPFSSGRVSISGEDSQPVSALLIAAAFAEIPITIDVENLGEKPWVDLTLHWLKKLGISYINQNDSCFQFFGKSRYPGFSYHVPGDFSSAAFPIAAALITRSALTLKNIDMNDPQGDKKVIDLFKSMGAGIHLDEENKMLRIEKGAQLSGREIDVNDHIDAITILAVVACFAEGETRIVNGAVARKKECDRIHCIASELRKMGADIDETADGLIIRPASLHGAEVESHGDHRMAMSLAAAALGARGNSLIRSVKCVSKTYPAFVRDFNHIGAAIQEVE